MTSAIRPGPAVLGAVRACYGAALLCGPGPVLRACTRHPVGSRALAVARVLGARHLLQATLTGGPAPSTARLRLGAAVDAAHAASMIGLAAADRTLRHATLADAAAAAAFAAGGLAAARGTPGTAKHAGHRQDSRPRASLLTGPRISRRQVLRDS